MSELHDPFTSPDEGDGLSGAIAGEPFSAGETGDAVADDHSAQDAGLEEVIVGEIPDASDLARMLWTARCTNPSHGLLGTYENQELAEQAKEWHLIDAHGTSA
jgi:hypothetical protein